MLPRCRRCIAAHCLDSKEWSACLPSENTGGALPRLLVFGVLLGLGCGAGPEPAGVMALHAVPGGSAGTDDFFALPFPAICRLRQTQPIAVTPAAPTEAELQQGYDLKNFPRPDNQPGRYVGATRWPDRRGGHQRCRVLPLSPVRSMSRRSRGMPVPAFQLTRVKLDGHRRRLP